MALDLVENLPAVFECVLHGLLPSDKHLLPFLQKIKEVCESPADAAHRFVRYECVYVPSSAQLAGPKQIRVRTLLDPNDLDLSKPSLEWTLNITGAQRWEKDYPCNVREHKTIPLSEGHDELLRFLGYRVDFQFVEKGYRFMHPLGIEITVFKPTKMLVPGDLKSLRDLASAHWMVKMCALAELRRLNSVPQAVRLFADHFRSLIAMERIDLDGKPQVAQQIQRP